MEMENEKDISEIIEEQAELLENPDVELSGEEDAEPTETTEEPEETAEEANDEEEAADTEKPTEASEEAAEAVEEPAGIEAPENWSADIKEAFSKADPATQQVWLEQQKEFQRGFNTVSQEAATLRREEEAFRPVRHVLDQVIPIWQRQGMSPEVGLGQLVQLGMAYASNPTDTIAHLAQMAGVELSEIGQSAPYRTQDDIERDKRMETLEHRLAERDREAAAQKVGELEREIGVFKDETDVEGNPAHPYFEECMPRMTELFANGFKGSLAEAYEQVAWSTPEIRQKMIQAVPATPKVNVGVTDQQRNAAAKATNASNQRVKQPKPAPANSSEVDGLSTDELVAHMARKLEANG